MSNIKCDHIERACCEKSTTELDCKWTNSMVIGNGMHHSKVFKSISFHINHKGVEKLWCRLPPMCIPWVLPQLWIVVLHYVPCIDIGPNGSKKFSATWHTPSLQCINVKDCLLYIIWWLENPSLIFPIIWYMYKHFRKNQSSIIL